MSDQVIYALKIQTYGSCVGIRNRDLSGFKSKSPLKTLASNFQEWCGAWCHPIALCQWDHQETQHLKIQHANPQRSKGVLGLSAYLVNLCLRAYLGPSSQQICNIWQVLKSIYLHLYERLAKNPVEKNASGKKCKVKMDRWCSSALKEAAGLIEAAWCERPRKVTLTIRK